MSEISMGIFWKKVLIGLSVVMSLGGAVNSGWSLFFPALPFMGYLLFVGYKTNKKFLVGAIVFVMFCIGLSFTRDLNPFLYPILDNGTVTVLQDGFRQSFSDGSGSFVHINDKVSVNPLSPFDQAGFDTFTQSRNERIFSFSDAGSVVTLTKLQRGEVYRVTGISHNNADFGDRIDIVTEVGKFSYWDFNAKTTAGGDIEFVALESNKPHQSAWAQWFGNLMYWPVFPVWLLSLPQTLRGR